MAASPDEIAGVLRSTASALTTGEIADALGVTAYEVDRVIWGEPDRFVWQPGHRWSLASEKSRPAAAKGLAEHLEARDGPMAAREPVQLRATTLASGVIIKVSRRALDSDALFTVKSTGNVVELVLNSSHEVFAELPMPFSDESAEGHQDRLVEILLEAWALYEDSIPGGPSRRAAEDIRFLWGRRILEVLRSGNG